MTHKRALPEDSLAHGPIVGSRSRRAHYLPGNRRGYRSRATVVPSARSSTKGTDMGDFDTVVERYLAVWNETDPAARRAAIDDLFTADVRFVDPLAAVEGRDALDALVGAAQGQFTGLTFTAGGPADAHHDQGRFTWHLGSAGAEPVAVGFDVAELAPDGRIRLVLGFIDKAPAM
jgi:hypothetical protein